MDFTHAKGNIDLELYDSGGGVLASSTSTTDDELIRTSCRVRALTTSGLSANAADSGNTYDLWWDDLVDDNYEETTPWLRPTIPAKTGSITWLSTIDG